VKLTDLKRNDMELIRVCKMYYLENRTQQEIAKVIGVSRSMVSRLLTEARKRGLVEIRIHEDKISGTDLEQILISRFDLVDATIVDTSPQRYLDSIAEAGASYLEKTIEDGMVVGISWGRTLAKVIDYIVTSKKLRHTIFVPLLGGVGQLRYEYQVNTLVEKIADAFDSARYYLHAPAFFDDHMSLKHMLNNESVRSIVELWDKLDLAVVGIGEPISLSNAFRSVLPQSFVSILVGQGAVGDIAARFFNRNGVSCDPADYHNHILGVKLEQLRKTSQVIGIAGGPEKVRAICAAMRGKLIKTLITDVHTAREIISVSDNENRTCM